MKKEITIAKNEEVKKIQEAFSDIIQANQPSNFPSSTKSEKLRYNSSKYHDESIKFPETSNVDFFFVLIKYSTFQIIIYYSFIFAFMMKCSLKKIETLTKIKERKRRMII